MHVQRNKRLEKKQSLNENMQIHRSIADNMLKDNYLNN